MSLGTPDSCTRWYVLEARRSLLTVHFFVLVEYGDGCVYFLCDLDFRGGNLGDEEIQALVVVLQGLGASTASILMVPAKMLRRNGEHGEAECRMEHGTSWHFRLEMSAVVSDISLHLHVSTEKPSPRERGRPYPQGHVLDVVAHQQSLSICQRRRITSRRCSGGRHAVQRHGTRCDRGAQRPDLALVLAHHRCIVGYGMPVHGSSSLAKLGLRRIQLLLMQLWWASMIPPGSVDRAVGQKGAVARMVVGRRCWPMGDVRLTLL